MTGGKNCLILEDQKQRPNSEFSFANSIYIDLRVLGIPFTTDFAFSCHSNYILLYIVARLSCNDKKKITGYKEKIYEIKITPGLFQKLRNIQVSPEDKKEKINMKEELPTLKH
jgi:hypothetical protein